MFMTPTSCFQKAIARRCGPGYSENGENSSAGFVWALCRDTDGQVLVALDEAGIAPLWLVHQLDIVEPLQDLLPDDLQLQFREPQAHAAVNAEAERQVRARPLAVDDEVVRLIDHLVVAVARDVPHHH